MTAAAPTRLAPPPRPPPPGVPPPLAPLANALATPSAGSAGVLITAAYLGEPDALCAVTVGGGGGGGDNRTTATATVSAPATPSPPELCGAAWSPCGRLLAAVVRDGLVLYRASDGGGPLARVGGVGLHFWPKAVSVRASGGGGGALARPTPSPPPSLPPVDIAVAGGPGVVLYTVRPGADDPAALTITRVRALGAPWPACAVAWSAGRGSLLAGAGPAGHLWLWRVGPLLRASSSPSPSPPPSITPLLHAQAPHTRVTALAFSPPAAAGTEDGHGEGGGGEPAWLAAAGWGGGLSLFRRRRAWPPPPPDPAAPPLLAMEACDEGGGPPAAEWGLAALLPAPVSGGGGGGSSALPAAAAPGDDADAGPAPDDCPATLLAWSPGGGGSSSTDPPLLALAARGRGVAAVEVVPGSADRPATARVVWEGRPAPQPPVPARPAPARPLPPAEPAGGLPVLALPPRVATAAGGAVLPAPAPAPAPAPPVVVLPPQPGPCVRGLAVLPGREGGLLWCDAEGGVGVLPWPPPPPPKGE